MDAKNPPNLPSSTFTSFIFEGETERGGNAAGVDVELQGRARERVREGESAAARRPPYAPPLDPARRGSGAAAAAALGPHRALQPTRRGSSASTRCALAALARLCFVI